MIDWREATKSPPLLSSLDNRVVAGSIPALTTKDLMRLKLNWMSSGLLHHRLQVRILSGVPKIN